MFDGIEVELPAGVAAYRYLSGHPPLLFPMVIVAKRGAVDDWAAYAAGLPMFAKPDADTLSFIGDYGCKLTEEQARGFFPNFRGEYRR